MSMNEMMDGLLWLKTLSVALARVLPIVIMVPLFSSRELKGVIRYGVAFALCMFIAPLIYGDDALHTMASNQLSFLLLKELVLGIVIGALMAMPFWLFDSVGALFDNQRGALIGGQFNPLLSGVSSPLSHMLQQCAIIVLIEVVGVNVLLDTIWNSYRAWPPLRWTPAFSPDMNQQWLANISITFTKMILYAAPLIVVMLFIEFAMALLGLYSPQMQVFVLSIPIKCLVGMAMLTIYLSVLLRFMEQDMEYFGDLLRLFV
ncbi:type III secretion protein SpaR [Vibrio coralliilyticus ATCC BAA-450]|uniref:EscT/YscT/HrcT family type III secretion system export apparatus protein n=2 Tax=Vibrionaceae TaxID=641 RepID=A0AAP7DFC3_9VIBR|nr:type III secretion protein SpaR [Vibrio coralliilyticus ATCC BAA-450]NOJ24280.1 EscT/YscT/HrcT family type III secretion system export apparatus protein [Vibrio coralliilyticus]